MNTRNTHRAEGDMASVMSDEDTISSPLSTWQTPDTALQTLQILTADCEDEYAERAGQIRTAGLRARERYERNVRDRLDRQAFKEFKLKAQQDLEKARPQKDKLLAQQRLGREEARDK